MKKLFIALTTIAGTLSVNGQYFEHRYGMPITAETTGSGQFTDYTGKGHIVSAHRSHELMLVRCDNEGRIPPGPYFSGMYKIVDANGIDCSIMSTRVAEFNNLTYGVVGVCESYNPTQQHIYYSSFDNMGTPLFTQFYDVSSGSISYTVNAIRVADSGDKLYLCGMAFNGIQNYAVVMKIDVASGTKDWGFTYEVDSSVPSGEPEEAFDLIENQSTNELLVVGQRHVCSTTSDDGFVLHLDPATGTILNPTNFYGTSSDADAFRSIDRSFLSANGYYISGWTGPTTSNRDHWVLSIDNTNTIVWSNRIDYNMTGPSQDNYGIDLLERVDYSNNPYVFAMGRTDNGLLGQDDIEVYKIDPAGGFVMDQFTFGNFRNETPSNIHLHNDGSAEDGLAIYSTREHASSNYDMMIHKAYFNGYTALIPATTCDRDSSTAVFTTGPGWLYDVSSNQIAKFIESPANTYFTTTPLDLEICYELTVTGGSNALKPTDNIGLSADVTVTQISNTSAVATIDSDIEQNMSFELRDAKGSLIRAYGSYNVFTGNQRVELNLSGIQLNTGVYFIQWSNGSDSGVEKLFIQ